MFYGLLWLFLRWVFGNVGCGLCFCTYGGMWTNSWPYIYIHMCRVCAGGCDVWPPFEQNQCTIKGPQTCTEQWSVQRAIKGPPRWPKQPTQKRGRQKKQTKGRTPRWGQEIRLVRSLFLANPYLQNAVGLKLPDRPAACGTKKPHASRDHRVHSIWIWTFLGHSWDMLERQRLRHLPFKMNQNSVSSLPLFSTPVKSMWVCLLEIA